jgi:ubiquinone/menaquinone biosynthesis C-methylase UbiE
MVNSQTDVCSYKKAWTLDNWFRKLIQDPYKILGGNIEKGQTVMDLGCGPGYFSLAMAEIVGEKGRVISVDIQEEMLQMLKEKSEQQGLKSRIILRRAQPEKLGLSEK